MFRTQSRTEQAVQHEQAKSLTSKQWVTHRHIPNFLPSRQESVLLFFSALNFTFALLSFVMETFVAVMLVWMLLEMLLLAELLLLMLLMLLLLLMIRETLCFVYILMHFHKPFSFPASPSTPPTTSPTLSSHRSHQPPAVRRLWKRTYTWSTSRAWRAFTFWFSWFPASFFRAIMGEGLWGVSKWRVARRMASRETHIRGFKPKMNWNLTVWLEYEDEKKREKRQQINFKIMFL